MMQSVARQWRTAGHPGSIVSIVVSPRGLHQVAHTCAARAGIVALTRIGRGGVGAAQHPRQLHRPRGDRLGRLGGVSCRHGAALRAGQPAAPRRQRPGRSPKLRCSWAARAEQFITGQTLHVNGGSNLWGETWTAGKPEWFVEASQAWQEP